VVLGSHQGHGGELKLALHLILQAQEIICTNTQGLGELPVTTGSTPEPGESPQGRDKVPWGLCGMPAPSLPRALWLRFSRFAYNLAHLGMLRARVVGSESLGPCWDPVDGPAHRLGGRGLSMRAGLSA
jgi:hypothetical protein